MKEQIVEKHIGNVAIDSGTLMMADPCRCVEVNVEVFKGWEKKEFGPSCIKNEYGFGIGVSMPTGLGDGLYPVFGAFQDMLADRQDEAKYKGKQYWRIIEVWVDFHDPFRGAGGCHGKEFPHVKTAKCLKSTPKKDWKTHEESAHGDSLERVEAGKKTLHEAIQLLDTKSA